MKKIYYFIIILFTMFSHINNVRAKQCTSEEIATYREKANNIILSQKFIDGEEKERHFVMSLYNVEEDFFVVESKHPTKIARIDENNKVINFLRYNVMVSVDYEFLIFLNDPQCYEEAIRSIKIKVPRYNEYSTLEWCNIPNNLRICMQTLPDNELITEEELKAIETAYNKYQDSKSVSSNVSEKKLTNNQLIIMSGSTLLILIFIIIVIKKRKKSII